MVRSTAKLVEAYLATVPSERRHDRVAAIAACRSVTLPGSAGRQLSRGVRVALPEARPA